MGSGQLIELSDVTGGLEHTSSDYQVTDVAPEPEPRKTQIRSVDFENGVIELFNFGDVDQPLDGWRFCTHRSGGGTFRYSDAAGLNGLTVEAGTSLAIHLNDDAPGGDDSVDLSTVAPLASQFALAVDPMGYGMQIYFPPIPNFSTGSAMADYRQWNVDGVPAAGANGREALAGTQGLWVVGDWIATTADTLRIDLVSNLGEEDHQSSDYSTTEPDPPAVFRRGDVDDDGEITIIDPLGIFFFVFLGSVTPTCTESADPNNSAVVDIQDGLDLLSFLFLAGFVPASHAGAVQLRRGY